MQIDIKFIGRDDWKIIYDMMIVSWPIECQYDENKLKELLNKSVNLVAYHNDKAVGFVGARRENEKKQIFMLGVIPEYQRNGIASKLLKMIITNEMVTVLQVMITNVSAINLYAKFGFIRQQLLKNYYSNGSDAFLMIRPMF